MSEEQAPPLTRAEKELQTVQRMFWGGCFALPWLWCLCAIYFWERKDEASAHPELRTWVLRCAGGFGAACAVFLTWVLIFQLNYQRWGWQSLLVSSVGQPQWPAYGR